MYTCTIGIVFRSLQLKVYNYIVSSNVEHPTIKFKAEISDTETVFLDTIVYKSTRFKENLSLM